MGYPGFKGILCQYILCYMISRIRFCVAMVVSHFSIEPQYIYFPTESIINWFVIDAAALSSESQGYHWKFNGLQTNSPLSF